MSGTLVCPILTTVKAHICTYECALNRMHILQACLRTDHVRMYRASKVHIECNSVVYATISFIFSILCDATMTRPILAPHDSE